MRKRTSKEGREETATATAAEEKRREEKRREEKRREKSSTQHDGVEW